MGDLTIRVTNTLDQGAGDESIGVGEFRLIYEVDPSIEVPLVIDYDDHVVDPDELWENNCGATQKDCQGYSYYGGHSQCAQGHSFWRVFDMAAQHPGANRVTLTGRVWTIDSWDGETFTVEMTNAQG
jgi:hypothetical protein